MLLNGPTLNGATLNGSADDYTHYASAALSGTGFVAATLLILAAATCSIQADGTVVTAGLYSLDIASANINAKSTLNVQSSAYVLKIPDQITVNGSSAVDLSPQGLYPAGAAITGQATLVPFQGNGAHISAGATVNAPAELGRWTTVTAGAGKAVVTASVILHADGVQPIVGSASVDPVPSMQFAGETFYTHDGHTRLAGAATLTPPVDPLHKIAVIENGGFFGYSLASAQATVAHYSVAVSLCDGVVASNPILDLYYQASVLFPNASLVVSPRVDRTVDAVKAKGKAKCYFTPRLLGDMRASVAGNVVIASAGGRYRTAKALIAVDGVIDGAAGVFFSGVAAIHGSNTVLASMASNPRADAIEKRTLVMRSEDRSTAMRAEDRTITLRSS